MVTTAPRTLTPAQVEAAIGDLRRAIRQSPEPLPLLNQLGQLCLRAGRLDAAAAAWEQYLRTHPKSSLGHFNLAWFSARLGQPMVAVRHYEKALELGIPRAEEAHSNLANLYSSVLRDDRRATQHLEQAIRLNPNYLPAMHNLGGLAEQQGQLERARELFERCLAINPAATSSLARLADTFDFREEGEALIGRLEAAAGDSQDPDLHFALGRAREQRCRYEDAWQCYAAANRTDQSVMPPYSPERVEAGIETLLATCTPEWLARLATRQAAAPVFICGMLRSGSTLIEQVLAAHPAFTPGGEREFFPRLVAAQLPGYPRDLTNLDAGRLKSWARAYQRESETVFGKDARITDKRPDNFLYIGLIKALFPSARVVVTRRDWRDVATSIFATRLGPMAPYATDLAHIRHFIRQHDRLIGHWQALLGDDLLVVDYEQVVAEPKAQIERLLNFLGESWDEACLDFHTLSNTVRTASVWQVRQPLYASSIGRWERFRSSFEGAFAEIGPIA
ncbi:MAG: tetratricopeptide repeat-containing sulfotransferase family protein [Steroidobacteraceae bacterium]